jgi:hypothetical protein
MKDISDRDGVATPVPGRHGIPASCGRIARMNAITELG